MPETAKIVTVIADHVPAALLAGAPPEVAALEGVIAEAAEVVVRYLCREPDAG